MPNNGEILTTDGYKLAYFEEYDLRIYRAHICIALYRLKSGTTSLSLMRKFLLFAAPGIAMVQALQRPYAIPTFATLSSNWPSASAWAALNSSVGGRLQALRPWAAVCYTSDPLYNAEACRSVLAGYDNDTQACIPCIRRHVTLLKYPLASSARSSPCGTSMDELGSMWL